MNIQTKYDIGQKLYTADSHHRPVTVRGIEALELFSRKETKYFFGRQHSHWYELEENLFPTLELAQAECERRNKQYNN